MPDVADRPTIIIHVGPRAPGDAYGDVVYNKNYDWIDRRDFDSKLAFSVVQTLVAVAKATQNTKTPVVTIPAG